MKEQKGMLVIAPFFRPSLGGAETYINELCEFFRKHNYFVNVFTYQPIIVAGAKGEKIEKSDNIQIRRLSWVGHDIFHKFQKYPLIIFVYLVPYMFAHCFFWMLKNHKKVNIIDAEGINAAFVAKILGLLFKKKTTVSILALYNFVPGSFFAKVVKWTLGGMDRIFVEKGKSKEELKNIGLSVDRFVIFNQWVDQNRFKPTDKKEAKRELGWENKFIVLFVGRAIPEKGAGILLEASRCLSDNITFVFISNIGPATKDIIAEAIKRKNIIFLGEINPLELHKYYQASDIFCLPSQYEEGVARVISESISCGTPIIASNRGSIPYVLDNRVAILINPEKEEFIKNINLLYSNQVKLQQLTENCQGFARDNFGEKNIHIIHEAVDELIK